MRSKRPLFAGLVVLTLLSAGVAISKVMPNDPLGCAPRGVYATAVMRTPGLAGYWRLGEKSGDAACDSTGRTNGFYREGTNLGQVGLLAGDKNRSLGLDGESGHVTVPSPALSDGDGAFAAEAWVSPSKTTVDQTVLRRDDQFLVRLVNEQVLFRLWWTDGSYTELSSSPVMHADLAQHVVASFDGNAMRLFRNGSMIASNTVAKVRRRTDSPLLIGGSNGYDYFSGQLDDVAEYTSPVDPSVVLSHYVAGSRDEEAGKFASTLTATTEANLNTLLAAGDIAGCDTSGDEKTAAILDREPGTVVTLGDNVYDDGSPQQFVDCYNPTWGRHLWRTRPAAGDHDYRTPAGSGYYGYFGAAAGDPSRGYYSFDQAGWHIVILNANCSSVGGCQAGSPQEQWLRADLAAHPALCTAAVVPGPRFSSGTVHGSERTMQPFWQALYDADADVVLSGDDHVYERFAPQTPTGVADPAKGIRQFTVGTGGRGHYPFGTPVANSEVGNNDTFGVLRLDLKPTGYDWTFLPEAGRTFTDTGAGACH